MRIAYIVKPRLSHDWSTGVQTNVANHRLRRQALSHEVCLFVLSPTAPTSLVTHVPAGHILT